MQEPKISKDERLSNVAVYVWYKMRAQCANKTYALIGGRYALTDGMKSSTYEPSKGVG